MIYQHAINKSNIPRASTDSHFYSGTALTGTIHLKSTLSLKKKDALSIKSNQIIIKVAEHTFQQLRTDIHKLHLLPQVSLVQLPNAGDEGVFFGSAAGHPPVYLLEVKVKFRIFLIQKQV